MHKLPIGIQDFAKIRENGFHYVDKTAAIHRLIDTGTTFFLSRPRRFGKSLLCSTLDAVWQGKRELFKGLSIDSLPWHWKKHPVLRLDLNPDDISSEDALKESLFYAVGLSARDHNVEIIGATPAQQLRNLIDTLAHKYSAKVVVIIDEYDKPLLGTIDNEKLHAQVRSVLKGFYGYLSARRSFRYPRGICRPRGKHLDITRIGAGTSRRHHRGFFAVACTMTSGIYQQSNVPWRCDV